MLVKCLVCDKPTSVMHMGVNICRACTVFYNIWTPIWCIYTSGYDRILFNACQENVFWCRRCRLDRLESVLRASRGEEMLPRTTQNYKDVDGMPLNQMALSMYRLTEELKFRGIHINRSDANEENYVLIPGTYQLFNCGTKHLIIGLFRLIESTFPEFQMLDHTEKWLLIRNYEKVFFCIDSALRTQRRLGKNSFNFYSSFTTYFSLETANQFFLDSPELSDPAVAAKTLHDWLQEVIPTLWLLFHQIDPTEDEFFALMGLAFWNIETFDASDNILALASHYRKAIINELVVKYRYSIGEENGTTRVGALICLIQEIRRRELMLRSDFEMYRLLGAFDDSTIAYRMQLTRN